MSALAIDGLIVGYGGAPVLDGIDLAIGEGERVGLFGPNGHGKTTLLRTVSGLLRPDRGAIHLSGQPIHGLAPAAVVALGLGHVPQSSTLFPEMEVQETLQLGAFGGRARQGARSTLERVFTLFPRLAERRRQKVKTLSGGERQMVAIGVGLMGAPRFLMLDEPTLGLSPKLKDELATAIDAIAQSGMTLLVVEQDVEFLLEVTTRLVMIDHGRTGIQIDAGAGIDHGELMTLYFGRGTSEWR